MLTILARVENGLNLNPTYLVRCECGKEYRCADHPHRMRRPDRRCRSCMMRARPAQKRAATEHTRRVSRERLQRLRAAGLCQRCARQPLANSTRCVECRDEHRIDMAAKRQAKAA